MQNDKMDLQKLEEYCGWQGVSPPFAVGDKASG